MHNVKDTIQLQRFMDAQEIMYHKALSELQAGKKENHWIWYIFPQTFHEGMGSVATRFALADDEIDAYLNHLILGPRLIECTKGVLSHKDLRLIDIFETAEDIEKFHS